MKAVWGYVLADDGISVLNLLKGSTVLSATLHQDLLSIWLLVDREETEREERRFLVVEPGQPIPEDGICRAMTASIYTGRVYHVFEVKKEK